jgi:hypothetical protein
MNNAADPALRERVADKKGEIEAYLRCFAPWVLGGGLRFLGGTADFNLWVRIKSTNNYPLRIHRVNGGSTNWDVFELPLHMNMETNGRIVGHWKDVTLSAEDVQIIEAYLRCFAPGVLGEPTNEEDMSNADT